MSLLRGMVRMLTQREWEEGYFNGHWFGTSLPASSGVTVTQETAMRMSAVYGCVRLLSDSVAGLPLQKFQKVNGERKQIPQDAWLRKPNREYTRYRFWQETMTGLLLDGNAFIHLYRTSSGSVAAAWPFWPPSVQVDRDDEGNRRYRVGNEYFTDWEILHIHGLTLPGQLRGLSPVGDYVAKNAVGLGIAAEDYAAALFANGAMPGGWIEAPSCKTEEEAKRIKQRWKEQQANAHEPAVLSGDWKWHTESFQPEATQLVESRGFQVEEICRIYGVPPHMVASVERSTSWGCVAPETDVIAWDGGCLRADEVAEGDALLAYRPDSGQYVKSRVTGVGRTWKPMVRITTARGRIIDVTADHPFWARSATYPTKHKELVYGEPCWVQAADLTSGQSAVLVAMAYPAETQRQWGVDLAWLAGLALGDGYVSKRDGTFSIFNACPEVLEGVRTVADEAFGTETYERQSGNGDCRHLSVHRINGAAAYIDALGIRGESAETKRVPAWVWQAPHDEVSAFLSGYLDSDGTVTEDGAVVWGSVSRRLLVDVQNLLARLGVQASLRLHTDACRRSVAGRLSNAQAFYHLKIRSKTGIGILADRLSPKDPKKAARLEAARRSGPRRSRQSYEWDRVKSVTTAIMRETVAIELDGPHTHITAGLVSHNTGIEQQGIQWVTYSLRPWLERIEQTVEPLLLPPLNAPKNVEVFCRFNAEGLLRGDLKSRLEAYEVGIRASIYTPNRCLAKEDEPPYEGGDVHYSQMNQYAIELGRPGEQQPTEPA